MVRIAHVGHGYWGRNLARNFSELGYLRAIVDADEGVAKEAAALYGVTAMTLDAALADSNIEAISLASPAGQHFSQARESLQAGKHVFVEKPLALEIAQAQELCELAEQRRLVLMVGHLLQYHPIYVRLREMVSAGEFGRLLYAYSNRLSLGKFRSEEDVLWSFAPHDVSMILGLFGEEPHHVSAHGNVSFLPGIADAAGLQMHFPGGGSARIEVSWMHPFKEQRLVVAGEKAMAVFEDSQPKWEDKLVIYRHFIDTTGPVPRPSKAEAERIAVPHLEPLKEECSHFISAIENGSAVRTDGREGLRVLRVLDQAGRAMKASISHQKSSAQ